MEEQEGKTGNSPVLILLDPGRLMPFVRQFQEATNKKRKVSGSNSRKLATDDIVAVRSYSLVS